MALSKKAEKRLTTLIEFMEALPKADDRHFNMANWFMHRGEHDHGFGDTITQEDLRKCGTTACALGWAATIPSFRRAGLQLSRGNSRYYIGLRNGPRDSSEAAMKFYDIDWPQFQKLFDWNGVDLNANINTPRQWARKAKRLVREWSKEAA